MVKPSLFDMFVSFMVRSPVTRLHLNASVYNELLGFIKMELVETSLWKRNDFRGYEEDRFIYDDTFEIYPHLSYAVHLYCMHKDKHVFCQYLRPKIIKTKWREYRDHIMIQAPQMSLRLKLQGDGIDPINLWEKLSAIPYVDTLNEAMLDEAIAARQGIVDANNRAIERHYHWIDNDLNDLAQQLEDVL